MRSRTFTIIARFEADEDQSLPIETQVAKILEHSTAREALSEATGCNVVLEVAPEQDADEPA